MAVRALGVLGGVLQSLSPCVSVCLCVWAGDFPSMSCRDDCRNTRRGRKQDMMILTKLGVTPITPSPRSPNPQAPELDGECHLTALTTQNPYENFAEPPVDLNPNP